MITRWKETIVGSINGMWRQKLTRDFTVIVLGKMVAVVLGFITSVIVIRNISDASYGILTLTMIVMELSGTVATLAVDKGLVRYLAMYLHSNRHKADLMLKATVKIRFLAGLVISVSGFAFAPVLAVRVFQKPELSLPFRLAFIAVLGVSFKYLLLTILQALEKFYRYVLVELSTPLVKLGVIIVLLLLGSLTLYPVILLYMCLPLVALILGYFFISCAFMRVKGSEREVSWELFHFSKWVGISYICSIIFIHLDVLMLTRFMDRMAEVGIYSIGFRFVSPILLLPSSLVVICLPIVSRLKGLDEYRGFFKNVLTLTVPLALFFCLLFPLSRSIIPFLSGRSPEEAAGAARVFNILLLGIIFRIITDPLAVLAYAVNKPQIIAYADILRVVVNFGGNYILIQGKFGFPALGIYGAAWATTATALIGGIFTQVYIFRRIIGRQKRFDQ